MSINFGREICGVLDLSAGREWLVTNGIGGYASGTVAGILTRRYHGLLVAALKPPLMRTLLLAKLDEAALYDGRNYFLGANSWSGGSVSPDGYRHIESFELEGTIPTWRFACADALLEKRVWMQPGSNTTYVQYYLHRATQPLGLKLKALVNYRDYHGSTRGQGWKMNIDAIEHGVRVTAFKEATPLYLLSDSPKGDSCASRANASPTHEWYYKFDLARERDRGLDAQEDHLYAANFEATLQPGESLTFVASTEMHPELNGQVALDLRRSEDQKLLGLWKDSHVNAKTAPDWINQLVLTADQFIVSRPVPNEPNGKTIIAGYHWFGDWGRDTMISLPGLTISVGRPELARPILRTFARYVDKGMLPNRFPDAGEAPEYNTVDATLWYFEAIRAYYTATKDDQLLTELFPVLTHFPGDRDNRLRR